MTRSEEESQALSLLAQLSQSDPKQVASALRTVRHILIGHNQTKALLVQLGIAEPLTAILGSRNDNLQGDWADARIEAGICIGSLAYGGESYVPHLVSSGALPRLTASLDPASSPPTLVLSSLRTLNCMLDTYVLPTSAADPTWSISASLYNPEVVLYLHKILSQTSPEPTVQAQIILAASLIAKSCRQQSHSNATEACEAMQRHQKLLSEAGVLDALAARLGSFYVSQRSKHIKAELKEYIPPPAPSMAKIAPILDAISAIIQGSKLRAIEFIFSPTLMALFPPNSSYIDGKKPRGDFGGTTATYIPKARSPSSSIQPPQQIITPSAFPPLSAAVSSASSSHFPPLSAGSSHTLNFSALHHYYPHHEDPNLVLLGQVPVYHDDSDGSTGGDTPVRRNGSSMDEEGIIHIGQKPAEVADTEPDSDVEETDLIGYLIAGVRDGDSLSRLAAAGVLTSLFMVGMVRKKLVQVVALLVIPILVRLLDEDSKLDLKLVAFGTAGVGGVDRRTWLRWQVEETAPAILAKLLLDNHRLQKAAFDAGVIKKLAAILKKACEPSSNTANGVNGNLAAATPEEPTAYTRAFYNHRMRIKDGALRCLANIGLFKEDYRKAIIEGGVVTTIVKSCLKPLTPVLSPLPPEQTNSEGNPPSVLIAACSVVRSISRSVGILRTSLIDAGVAVPIFSLLRHEDIDVRIAACTAVCNLVLDFSPMRRPIMEAGAVDVLCALAKSDNFALKLNALWALKHLVLDADKQVKKQSFEGLGPEYIMSLCSNMPSMLEDYDVDEEEDEDMDETDDPATMEIEDSVASLRPWRLGSGGDLAVPAHLPPKAAAAVRVLHKQERVSQTSLAQKQTISLQEQTIEYLRNLVYGSPSVVELADMLFERIDADWLLGLMETIIANATAQPGEVVNASVHLLVHIAAGAPRHRQKIIERKELVRSLLGLSDHRIAHVRSGLAWIIINLTWSEEGEEVEGVRQRIAILKNLGFMERLREMKKDTELDVQERVKAAEHCMTNLPPYPSTSGASSGSGSGSR